MKLAFEHVAVRAFGEIGKGDSWTETRAIGAHMLTGVQPSVAKHQETGLARWSHLGGSITNLPQQFHEIFRAGGLILAELFASPV